MPIIRRSNCVPLSIVFCPVVAVVMLESRVASCVKHVEILLITNKSLFVVFTYSKDKTVNTLRTKCNRQFVPHSKLTKYAKLYIPLCSSVC